MHAITLTIDFGETGTWHSRHPFRVTLDAAPLVALLRAARDAHRMVELLLVQRPGDIWAYVEVVPDLVPARVARLVERAHDDARPRFDFEPHPWPADRIPFEVFDALFHWGGDDTPPEDEAWRHHRDSAPMQAFARQAFAIVRAAQNELEWNDPLKRHVAARVRAGEHAYCFLGRDAARNSDRRSPPHGGDRHSPGFYRTLDQLLCDPELASVAYRAIGDYRVLRMMAAEQRRRAVLTGHDVGNALALHALTDAKVGNESWESRIGFHDEGLGHGSLFIQGPGLMGAPIKELVETRRRIPDRYILSHRDEGVIEGFGAPESGDGWSLYTRLAPLSRRSALDRVSHRRFAALGAVLSFADGESLHDYEKAIVVVGAGVPSAARAALASAMAEWQQHGGDPLIVVEGELAEFAAASCVHVISARDVAGDDASRRAWLTMRLQEDRPWLDAALLLDAPQWAAEVVSQRARASGRPWPMWIVATDAQTAAPPDHVLAGDLARTLAAAHLRARAMRSSPS